MRVDEGEYRSMWELQARGYNETLLAGAASLPQAQASTVPAQLPTPAGSESDGVGDQMGSIGDAISDGDGDAERMAAVGSMGLIGQEMKALRGEEGGVHLGKEVASVGVSVGEK